MNIIKIIPFVPSSLAKRWKQVEIKPEHMAAFMDSKTDMTVVSSIEIAADEKNYIHLEVFKNLKRPDWDEVITAKNAFIGKDKKAYIPLFDDNTKRDKTSIHIWGMIDE